MNCRILIRYICQILFGQWQLGSKYFFNFTFLMMIFLHGFQNLCYLCWSTPLTQHDDLMSQELGWTDLVFVCFDVGRFVGTNNVIMSLLQINLLITTIYKLKWQTNIKNYFGIISFHTLFQYQPIRNTTCDAQTHKK